MSGEVQTSKVVMHDSGTRQDFDTGAVRDAAEGKGMPSLISPELGFRLSKWLELGAFKYSPRNWEKGIPVSRCIDSLERHIWKYLAGMDDEDHLAAAVCNLMFIMHYEKYNPGMQDIPLRLRKVVDIDTADILRKMQAVGPRGDTCTRPDTNEWKKTDCDRHRDVLPTGYETSHTIPDQGRYPQQHPVYADDIGRGGSVGDRYAVFRERVGNNPDTAE